MKQNCGALDSTLRVGIGFFLVFVAFLLAPPASTIAYVGALVATVTGFSGRCPLYKVFGIDTNRSATS